MLKKERVKQFISSIMARVLAERAEQLSKSTTPSSDKTRQELLIAVSGLTKEEVFKLLIQCKESCTERAMLSTKGELKDVGGKMHKNVAAYKDCDINYSWCISSLTLL
ncbi:hypothetical protein CHARACLAT_029135 [Characodon lateralis]|uniref:Uncharacterized protein n=1 Tax=Characodon lateralis TaxID=208331 RepID=A0ABU7E571_9TELE|nr:hypothetical protein [Characodon lateralis]